MLFGDGAGKRVDNRLEGGVDRTGGGGASHGW